MLISSERHRPEDLELWRELETADWIHGDRFASSEKVSRSIDVIRSAINDGPHWIGCSWGKDSVCLAHLCYRASAPWPLVFFRVPGHEPAETDSVRDSWMGRFPRTRYVEIETPRPVIVYGDRYDLKPAKMAGGNAARSEWGRWVNGLRADESGRRAIYLRKFGIEGCETAISPLGWWSTADIFGYMAHYSLPVHPTYAMLGNGRWPREQLRVSPMGGIMGETHGRAEFEREYYGDVLRRLGA